MNREVLAQACERVLRAEITIEQLQETVGLVSQVGELEKTIFSILEDAVEHAPGFLLSGKIDLQSFRNSNEFGLVELCQHLLCSGLPDRTVLVLLEDSKRRSREGFIQGVCYVLSQLSLLKG